MRWLPASAATVRPSELVHWPLMGGLLHLVQRGEAGADRGPVQSPPHCTDFYWTLVTSSYCVLRVTRCGAMSNFAV